MRQKNLLIAIVCAVLLVCVIVCFTACYSPSDYASAINANWGISLPAEAKYKQEYENSTEASFNGDGFRYHVFSYEKEEPIDKLLAWSQTERKTIYCDSIKEAALQWLNEIGVPKVNRPTYKDCVYWYQSQDDNSELLIFKDAAQKKLYVVECFL